MSELWVPPSAVERVAFECACGAQFGDPVAGRRHAVKCIEKHRDELEESHELREEPGLGSPMDKEAWEWGKRRIAEGKPGFKRGKAA